jgi:hypothetical protein
MGLIRLDVGRLDDRPPFLDLGLVTGAKRFRRLLFARRDFLAHVGESLANGGIGKGIDDGGIELGDNVLGRPLGNPEPVPERKIERRYLAIRCRARDAADADAAAGTASIFHHHRLAERRPVAPPAGNGTTMVIGRVG